MSLLGIQSVLHVIYHLEECSHFTCLGREQAHKVLVQNSHPQSWKWRVSCDWWGEQDLLLESWHPQAGPQILCEAQKSGFFIVANSKELKGCRKLSLFWGYSEYCCDLRCDLKSKDPSTTLDAMWGI